VDDVGGVDVLEAFEDLVDDELFVDFFEDVAADDGVEVDFDELEDEVDVVGVLGFDDVEQPDDALVALELVQEDHLAVGALGVRGVVEGVENLR
jgi:hypothetical protein